MSDPLLPPYAGATRDERGYQARDWLAPVPPAALAHPAPVDVDDFDFIHCPCCGRLLANYPPPATQRKATCPRCGQVLDWTKCRDWMDFP